MIAKYRNVVSRSYGWNVELVCGQCKSSVMPRYEGRLQHVAAVSGDATVFAKLACPACGHRLIDEPVRKLADLFADVPVSAQNHRIVKQFIAGLVVVPVMLAFVLFMGMQMGWWGNNAFRLLALSAAVIPLLAILRNYRIALLRSDCDCKKPVYRFLGSLQGTNCYRCSSCGQRLRLRE